MVHKTRGGHIPKHKIGCIGWEGARGVDQDWVMS